MATQTPTQRKAAARKAAATRARNQRSATAKRAAATRKRNTTAAQRSATAKRAAATRKGNEASRSAQTTRSQGQRAAESGLRTVQAGAVAGRFTLEAVATQAQRAALIPVGAALSARDNLVEAVKPYTSLDTAERQITRLRRDLSRDLTRFERRGATAQRQVQREVKRTRTRVERELRQRRNQAQRSLKRNRRDLGKQVGEAQANAEQLAKRVSEQVASLA